MSDVDVGLLWPPGFVSGAIGGFMRTTSPSLSANNMSAADHKVAVVFDVPVSGELHSFEYAAPVLGGPVATLRASWQDVDASDNPDGGVDQFCLYPTLPNNTWAAPPNALTHDGSAGGVRRTVTRGQRLAAVLDFSAWTSGTLSVPGWNSEHDSHGAQLRQFTTVWAVGSETPAMALRYTDGYRAVFGTIPAISAYTTTLVNSGSTPNHRAMLWTQGVTDTCLGLWAFLSGGGAACDLVLFEGATEVGRLTWAISVSFPGMRVGYFTTPITLTAGLVYRAAVVPTTGSNVTVRAFVAHAADAQLGGIPDVVAGMGQSTRTGTGPWTDSTARLPMVGPIVVNGYTGPGPSPPVAPVECTDDLTDDDLVDFRWDAGDSQLVNKVIFEFDYDDDTGGYTKMLIYSHDDSIRKYGPRPEIHIQSQGVHTSLGAEAFLEARALEIFRRFGEPSAILQCTVFYRKHVWEAGDIICVTSDYIPNLIRGNRGLDEEPFELVDFRPQFVDQGRVIATLIDIEAVTTQLIGDVGVISPTSPQVTPPVGALTLTGLVPTWTPLVAVLWHPRYMSPRPRARRR